MSEPTFRNGGGSYRLTWDLPELVTIDFERLQVDRREVSAEVRVSSTAPGASGLLHQRRLNLDSDIAIDRFAAKLTKRTPGTGLEWDALLEFACLRVQDAHRVGKPPMLLRDIEEPASAGWLLRPIALSRLPVIIFGDGSTCKSYTLLAAAVDICSDHRLLGLEGTARLRVGYLDAEFDGWEHKKRLRRLVGEGIAGVDIVYIESQGSLRSQVERLQRIIRDEEIGYLIGDSVTFLCDGPPEDAESARAFFDAFRQLGIGGLFAAHTNRSQDPDRPFGSVFWHNGARATWYVKKQQETGSDRVTIGLYNKKSNVDRLANPLGFRFIFEQDRTFIEHVDVRDVSELAGSVALKDRIERALREGALTTIELAELLEAEPESVSRVVRRYDGKLFAAVLDGNGRRRIGLLQRGGPDSVRTVSASENTRADGHTPPLKGVSGPVSAGSEEWWQK